MKINYKTTTKIAVALLIWEIIVELNNTQAIARLKRQKAKLSEINHLLAQKLDANGIELDTFEEIAINDIIHSK